MKSPLFADQQDFLSETLNDLLPAPPTDQIHLNDGTCVTRLGLGGLTVFPKVAIDNTPLIFSAAIHGNETAPIEVCNQIISEILSEEVSVQRPTLFIFGNPAAMRISERFVDENLNRLFLGKHSASDKPSNLETERAAQLEQWVEEFIQLIPNREVLWHYDLHTAIRGSHREKFALYPFVPNRKPPESQLALLNMADVQTLLLQATPAGTFSALTSVKYQAESFTIELGSVRPFGQNDLSKYQAIKKTITLLIEGREIDIDSSNSEHVEQFEVCHEIIKTGDQFQLNIDDDVWNFTEFPPKTTIWLDQSEHYQVGDSPEFIVFPNKQVPVGQRAGLMLRKTIS